MLQRYNKYLKMPKVKIEKITYFLKILALLRL